MGGFYGSVQVRTEDRQAVLRAAGEAARLAGIRCLVGPLLDGWVAVYPEGAGQDQRIGQAIALRLGGEVLQAYVHDDDVMVYWFWFNGQLTDSYWSNPGYFDESDRAAEEQMSGDVQAFGDLLADRADAFHCVLERRNEGFTFEANRLRDFAELLGIRNAVTSYELLRGGERAEITGWEQFEEVPEAAASAEQAAQRQRRLQAAQKRKELRQKWILLSDEVEERLVPRACAVGGGIMVAWEGYGRGETHVEFFRPPWGEAEPAEIETGGSINSMAADAHGRRMAIALGNRVVVWEAGGWRPILELVEENWATECALSPGGDLLAYAARNAVYVHEVDSGKRVTALSAHGGPVLAFHPTGEYLLSAGNAVWIARTRDTAPWRQLYPGGQTAVSPDLAQAVRQEMTHIDVDAMQAKWKLAMENAVAKLAATGQNPAATAQIVARMRQQMDKQLDEMRAKFANLKAGKIAPPRQANEAVLCAGFTRDGARLWLGTDHGLHIFDWKAVESTPAESTMPRPIFSYAPAQDHGPATIYGAAEVPGRAALLFGGFAGKLCEMDLRTGRVRELAAPPEGGAITGVTITSDASAVGVCSRPALGESPVDPDERAVWEIWSYAALAKA